ncbi:MAG: hypothetical protein LC685_01250, partial [Actinobacteria bacterium]|nr:hypothetical protein [Actinomycetota bacterium]
MSSLEQQLQRLGQELEYPPEPDVAPAVLARLDRRPFPWRLVAVAFAVVAVAVGAAFAVPQARTTILKWFHLRGVTVELVETLPPAVERSQAGGLGRPLAPDEAERAVGFELALPPGTKPGRVYVLDGTLASVVLRSAGRPLLLSEYRSVNFDLLKKSAVAKSVIEPVRVNGEPGLWLEGGPHTLTYFNRRGEFRQRTVMIRGNVLLWIHGQLTLRLEGRLTKTEALRIG